MKWAFKKVNGYSADSPALAETTVPPAASIFSKAEADTLSTSTVKAFQAYHFLKP